MACLGKVKCDGLQTRWGVRVGGGGRVCAAFPPIPRNKQTGGKGRCTRTSREKEREQVTYLRHFAAPKVIGAESGRGGSFGTGKLVGEGAARGGRADSVVIIIRVMGCCQLLGVQGKLVENGATVTCAAKYQRTSRALFCKQLSCLPGGKLWAGNISSYRGTACKLDCRVSMGKRTLWQSNN